MLGAMFGGMTGGTLAGASISGLLGHKGVQDTNKANERIASARNAMEVEEAQKSRDFSASQAEINRDFQERMSSSAVSRRMKDMKGAGINPILAAKHEASTPAGGIGATAKANAHGYEEQNKIQGFLNNAGAMLQLQEKVASIDNINANTKLASNKGEIIEPLSMVMDVLASHMAPGATSAKSQVGNVQNIISNIKKDYPSAKAKTIDYANKVRTKIEGAKKKVTDKATTWWKKLRENLKQYRNMKNWR